MLPYLSLRYFLAVEQFWVIPHTDSIWTAILSRVGSRVIRDTTGFNTFWILLRNPKEDFIHFPFSSSDSPVRHLVFFSTTILLTCFFILAIWHIRNRLLYLFTVPERYMNAATSCFASTIIGSSVDTSNDFEGVIALFWSFGFPCELVFIFSF